MVIPLLAVALLMECKKTGCFQETQQSVSRGVYDFIKSAVVIPSDENWSIMVDQEAWKAMPDGETPPEIGDLEPNSFDLRLVLYNAAFPEITSPPPPLDPQIIEELTTIGPIDWESA